jgi:hypothetical protein
MPKFKIPQLFNKFNFDLIFARVNNGGGQILCKKKCLKEGGCHFLYDALLNLQISLALNLLPNLLHYVWIGQCAYIPDVFEVRN